MFNSLLKPATASTKLVYAPVRTNNLRRQEERNTALNQRMMSSSARPEKKNGLRR